MAQIHEVTSLVTATTVRAINIKSEVGTSIPFDAEKKKKKSSVSLLSVSLMLLSPVDCSVQHGPVICRVGQ